MADVMQIIKGGFFDSVNQDRLYSASDMNMPYKRIVSDGIFPDSNGSASQDFIVSFVEGMLMSVAPGNALLGGRWAESLEDVDITIAGNSSAYDRIDSIILRADASRNVRAIGIVCRQGEAAESPVAPALESSADVTELRIANVYIPSGAASLSSASISDQRGGEECPWVAGVIPPTQAQVGAAVDEYLDDHPGIFVVDSEFSDSSTNAVQNKVVAAAVGEIQADIANVDERLDNTNERLDDLHDVTYDRVETAITPSLINDYYIWGTSGASTSGNRYYDGNYVYTDYTEVGNNTWLKVTMNKLSASSPRGIAFYDSEKVYITGYGMNGGGDGSFEVREFEIPDGAVYFRTCFDETLASRSDFSAKLITEVGGAVLVETEKTRAEAAENALGERMEIIETYKTVSVESLVDSKFVNVTSGGTPTSADWVCTPHIDMPFDSASGYEIRGTFYGNGGCVIYGESGEVLLGIGGSNVANYGGASDSKLQTITVPYVAGAKTIRISGYKSKVSAASDLWIKGNTFNDTYEHIYNLENDVKALEANISTVISQSKVLVIGDSISTDSYGNYKKWVTRLIESGFLPSDTTNSSRHATGFVARYNNEANDFITRIKAIENPSQYDLVVVFGGINDYIQNIPMGEATGTDYTVSFKPAVNEFFSYLIENFTQARICVLLPLRTKATWKNSVNEYEWSYSEYIHTVAKSYCFPVLNLTEESGFCPFISTFQSMWTLQPEGYTGHDGVHPNEEYERRFLAPMIKHFLQGML